MKRVRLTRAMAFNVSGYDTEARQYEAGEQDAPDSLAEWLEQNPDAGEVLGDAVDVPPSGEGDPLTAEGEVPAGAATGAATAASLEGDENLRDEGFVGEEEEVVEEEVSLDEFTVPELRDLAAERGVDVGSRATKAEIIEALEDAEAGGATTTA